MKSSFFHFGCLLITISCQAATQDSMLTLHLAHGGSKNHPYHIGSIKFAELVRLQSKGKVRIEIHPEGQLGSEGAAAEGVRLENMDIAIVSAGGMMSRWVPLLQLLDMPYLFRSRMHAYHVVDGEIGRALDQEMENAGFKNIAYWEIGIRHLTNNERPIVTINDVKGLSIRVMASNVYFSLLKAWGAKPIPIAFGDLYDALQRGIVAGEENPVTTIQAMHFYKTQRYLSLTAHTHAFAVVVMNANRHRKMSPEIQEILKMAAIRAAQYERVYVQKKEREALAFLRKKGMIISYPDANSFKEAARIVYRDMAKEVPPIWIEKVSKVY